MNEFQVDLWLIILVAVCVVAFIALVVNRGIRVHRRQVSAGREELVGRTAIVVETLKPEGMVFVEGERWKAVAEENRMEPGEEVIITEVESLKLYVTKKQKRR